MADNWSGTVHDRTGEATRAGSIRQSARPAPPKRITELFGGELVGCSYLLGDYYSCPFT